MKLMQLIKISLLYLCVLSCNNEVEGTIGQIRNFFDRFFASPSSTPPSARKTSSTSVSSKLPPTTTAVPKKPHQKQTFLDTNKSLKIHLTESYDYPTTPNSTEEFLKWEALEEKKYAEGILKKLSEPNDTQFEMEAKTLIANLVVNAVLDNVTHDSIGGEGNSRNVSARRTDGETALSSIVDDAPADGQYGGEWSYENQHYQQQQQQPPQSGQHLQSSVQTQPQGQQQYELLPGQQIQETPLGQEIPTGQQGGEAVSNVGYPDQPQGQINAGEYPQIPYPNIPIVNPGDPNYQTYPGYYPSVPQPPTTTASYLGLLNSIRNALTAATGNDTKSLDASPLNSVLSLLGPRGSTTTPSPDESTEYYVVPANPSTERNTISAHQSDLLGQVGRLRENVGKRNISGVIDESLKLASLQTVGVFVTNFLDLLLCNPVDRWNGMCPV